MQFKVVLCVGLFMIAKSALAANTYPLTLQVFASSANVMTGNASIERVIGLIGDQPVVMEDAQGFSPLLPGTYPARLISEETGHGAQRYAKYGVKFPDGKEQSFNLTGLCAKGSTICYGVSFPPQP
jgi:hypothetical protein